MGLADWANVAGSTLQPAVCMQILNGGQTCILSCESFGRSGTGASSKHENLTSSCVYLICSSKKALRLASTAGPRVYEIPAPVSDLPG